MKIEFFHDVICSFCFPMSYRMHQIKERYPNVDIVHRSFALAWESDDLANQFGSRDNAKNEILKHWEHANENDDLHRFNISGMKEATFQFPTSKPALLAATAAKTIGGDAAYWNVFDSLQHKLFVENKNIEDITIIKEVITQNNIDWLTFEPIFTSEETEKKVFDDIKLAQEYNIHGAPFLVINEKYGINGAQSVEVIQETIEKIAEQEHEPLILIENGNTCSLDKNGTWVCE